MAFFTDWLTVLAVGAIAIVTPGPDFALTLRSSLVHSKRAGLYTAIGVGAGNTVHATYSLVGIGAIISQSILFFSLLKWAGAAYLIFLGVEILTGKKDDCLASRSLISSHLILYEKNKKKADALGCVSHRIFGKLVKP
ncbi:MAG: LysE family translocator [Cyanobacteria bacterium P01_F01_bin.53]